VFAGLTVLSLVACGYRVTGKADTLPDHIRTIAIPAWGNLTARYRLADRLPMALTREFISRTRYHVVADPQQADATLDGTVVNIFAYPTLLDQATGRPSGIQMVVIMQVKLTERGTGRALYDRQALEARQRYEISIDPVAYFEESSPALDRLAREVAQTVVSGVLEAF
jgi:hypothetical protein